MFTAPTETPDRFGFSLISAAAPAAAHLVARVCCVCVCVCTCGAVCVFSLFCLLCAVPVCAVTVRVPGCTGPEGVASLMIALQTAPPVTKLILVR